MYTSGPYNEQYPVVCMDESPKQLIEEGRPSLPMKPGEDAKVDYEYVRKGVVNQSRLYLILEGFKQ